MDGERLLMRRMRGTDDVVWLEAHRHRRPWRRQLTLDVLIVVGIVVVVPLVLVVLWWRS
jgi:hypothetical protein